MMQQVREPLRDQVGRALYEEPGHVRDWYQLSEAKREPWRKDADRILPVVTSHIEAEARRYAEMYQVGSDGRNTFSIFADWCAALIFSNQLR